MLSRIHVCTMSLGLLLAGPPIAMGQALLAAALDSATAPTLPSYEVKGIPITPHQFSVLGSAHVEERSPSPSLVVAGMPASAHQIAVLTPRPGAMAKRSAATATTVGLTAR